MEVLYIPKISIIIPVYNAEKYIKQCLDSVINQTLKDFEIICVDDGSTDNSLEILKHYAQLDSRIHILTQQNLKAGIARNNGMEAASGEYITFLDSDDIMLPDALELLYFRAIETKADVVLSSAYAFGENINDRKIAESCLKTSCLPKSEIFSISNHSEYIFQITSGVPWGKLYRHSFIKKHQIQFPGLPKSEDVYFVYLALVLAEKIAVINNQTVLYRVLPDGESLENSKDIYPLATHEVRVQLGSKLKELGIYDYVRRSFINNIIDTMAYNFRTFKTGKAFEQLYYAFKNEMIPTYQINLIDVDYYYDRNNYYFLKSLMDFDSCSDYFHYQLKKEKVVFDNLSSSAGHTESMMTFIAYKFYRGIKCLCEHGLFYTIKHSLKKASSIYLKK